MFVIFSVTLTRGDENFRGFLVVSENMMAERVGSFNAGNNQRQACGVSIEDDLHIALVINSGSFSFYIVCI